jgi:hypothetical protein
MLGSRVADFEAKLLFLLDRVVSIAGASGIITISIIGGLIVSVRTSLRSVSHVIG